MTDVTFEFELESDLPPAQAWRRIVDVSRHGEVVPFTTGRGPAPQDVRVGSRFVARTALGPVGFDDVMVVRAITPGQDVVFEKTGRLLGGVVAVQVSADGAGSLVWWRQSIVLPWVPPVLAPAARPLIRAAAPLVRAGYRRTLVALLTEPSAYRRLLVGRSSIRLKNSTTASRTR